MNRGEMDMRNDIHRLIEPSVGRRRFAGGLGAGLLLGAGLGGRRAAAAAPPLTLVTSIRSLSNPYHAVWKQGADAFARSVGLPHTVLVSEGNSEKGISDIRAMIARTGGHMVLNSDPNDTPDARPIVEACAKAGTYVVTQWNKPADLLPENYNPYYVSFIAFDGVVSGRTIAEHLFKAMGGKGGIIAIGGSISTTAAIERKQGLQQALAAHPDIKLLAYEVGDWKATQAYDLTNGLLTRFGDDVKGIWAANDDMGTGALEALRAAGSAGHVPIVGIDGIKEAVLAVKSGEFACTISSGPFWQGGMGLSIAYHAAIHAFDPSTQPPLHRQFYGKTTTITRDNVASYISTNIDAHPDVDWNDLWGNIAGPVRT